ncbi:YhbY family RNA-binding protein [Infirmifilum lucidum]|uniref:YhbY family RNA-binding protein n=1 Tax=Infirmifilum lucidum TaxID=2776706 RepID=A0A7L9FJE9_9CREN|nr:YhbY family RNA-binding protein [Infirmifilum lucidum]QOJ79472.1 YhbY family RNA-binding protein [Infirmifilum lucidum]
MSSVFQDPTVVTVNVGKNGLSERVLEEIDNALKSRGVVKVRLLKNFRETYGYTREDVAVILSQRLGAEVIGIRGNVIALRRKKSRA